MEEIQVKESTKSLLSIRIIPMSLEPQESLQTSATTGVIFPVGSPRTESSAPVPMACPEPVALGWPWPGLWPSVRPQLRERRNVTVHLRSLLSAPGRGLARPPAYLCLLLPRAGRYCGLRAEVGT